MIWNPVYDPLGSAVLSTLAAGIPVAVLLVGAFFEGAAGFGTPVAVTGAILIGRQSVVRTNWTRPKNSDL